MQKYHNLTNELWRELCLIPAPSHHEDKRAEYICNKLKSWGLNDTYIDDAKNVVSFVAGNSKETVVFAAHTDTVFPDMEAMPFSEDDINVYCPGCGDDTVDVAMLMSVLKYFADSCEKPQYSIIFAFNSCEEGLGNLKGIRAIMDKYGQNVIRFYTFDGKYDMVAPTSVGSHRYRVKVKTEGGHSYSAFGNNSAVHILAKGINEICNIKVPQEGGKTTYNVGLISGGTSVNTIAEDAEMICEYRSVSHENLEYMKQQFEAVFEYMRSLGAEVNVTLVGERPCMRNVDKDIMDKMTKLCMDVQHRHTGHEIKVLSASTDCNIPHSMGIPAICVGAYMGGCTHTREEWVEKASVLKGFEIIKDIVSYYI